MRILRRIGMLLLVFIVGALAFQNQESLGRVVDFKFLRWNISFVLGFWLFFSFASGCMLFLLLDAWRNIRLRWELRRRDQEIARLQAAAGSAPGPSTPSAQA